MTLCSMCGDPAECFTESGFCPHCVEPAPPPAKAKARRLPQLSAGDVLLLVGLIGILASVGIPHFKAARARANTRACYANQKTIVGAVEMYNLDKMTKVELLSPLWTSLKSGGYLQSTPNDPGQGPGTKDNYSLTGNSANGIRCKVHGTIE